MPRIKLPRKLGGRGWLVVVCAALLISGLTGPGAAKPAESATSSFDFDTGNAATEVIFPAVQKRERLDVSLTGSDVSLVLDYSMQLEVSWFDAVAPYYQRAVGIYTNLGHVPSSEATTRNKNISILYAAYRILNNRLPKGAADWREMMTSVGLDPDNNSTDPATPPGIGNLAAEAMIKAHEHDGMNELGDEGGRKYNRQPFADYTGFKPVNTAYELRDPSKWQPAVVANGTGTFSVQQFVTPQLRFVKPYTYTDPAQFELPPPSDSDVNNFAAYKRQADQVVAASAHLTDAQKMIAELVNDKLITLGAWAGQTALSVKHMDIGEFAQYLATVEIADWDTLIWDWYYKFKYDSVRPWSAIRYLYGDKQITAWGGPGMGTVSDITGNEWRSYIPVADHPEYPSVTSSLCQAYSQAARLFLGTDEIDAVVHFPKGSSKVEPGITPSSDIDVRWDTWTDFAKDCGMARLWGGVHFLPAIVNVWPIAPQFGTRAYEFIQRHLEGNQS